MADRVPGLDLEGLRREVANVGIDSPKHLICHARGGGRAGGHV